MDDRFRKYSGDYRSRDPICWWTRTPSILRSWEQHSIVLHQTKTSGGDWQTYSWFYENDDGSTNGGSPQDKWNPAPMGVTPGFCI